MRRGIKYYFAKMKRAYSLLAFRDHYCLMINGQPYRFSRVADVTGKKNPTSMCEMSLECQDKAQQ